MVLTRRLHVSLALPLALVAACAQGEALHSPPGAAGSVSADANAAGQGDDGPANDDAETGAVSRELDTDTGLSVDSGDEVGGSIDHDGAARDAMADANAEGANAIPGNDGGNSDAGGDSGTRPLDASFADAADVINDVGAKNDAAEAGPLGPCSGLCATPIVFTTPFQSGALGTAATCHQTTAPLQGFVCGGFVAPRTLSVNGVVVTCDGVGRNVGAVRNRGYCFQATAGNETSEYFNTY